MIHSTVISLFRSFRFFPFVHLPSDGRILLHHLKSDQTLATLTQEDGAVTAVAFRTDGTPTLVSASARGHLSVWDLERKSLVTVFLVLACAVYAE
jgi:WD40 repeat protein